MERVLRTGADNIASSFACRIAAVAVTFALTAPLAVESQSAPPGGTPTPTVTRADLAASYMRLDRVLSAKTVTDTVRAGVSRAFDRSTLAFFGGRFLAAVTTIDSLTVAISGAPLVVAPPPSARLVNGKAPSIARERLLARLAKVDSSGVLLQALVSARARASLLVDVPSVDRSAEFLTDPARLAADVEREVSALERGKNPYAKLAGDHWRTVRGANGAAVPFRIVASKAVASAKTAVPLLIVLHGAGGDENMFVDAYGAGITPRLAQERGWLLVSPATTAFGASPANFDLLLAQLKSEYAIDSSRVYLLGHSMGAGAAARLQSQRPTTVAGTVCLAGGAAVKTDVPPRMLFVGAALDPIIPAATVKAAAMATPGSVYRELANVGHTLMVSEGVRMGMEWLGERR